MKAQAGYGLPNDLKIVLPIVSLLLLGAGVGVAPGHRRAMAGAGAALGLAASTLVFAAALAVFWSAYLNSVACQPAAHPAEAGRPHMRAAAAALPAHLAPVRREKKPERYACSQPQGSETNVHRH